MDSGPHSIEIFAASRPRLLGLAYRMLGSRADAEDILQDAWLRYQGVAADSIRDPQAWLTTVVTRLSLDRLKRAQTQREIYVGPWLPEPIIDADSLSPEAATELADDLSFALLLTLERLTPAERAAFLLHDVFDTPFPAVAVTLEKSEAACRQLASRARKAVRRARPEQQATSADHLALLQQFVIAVGSGQTEGLMELLSADAIAYADGGGVRISALNPIRGKEKVARFHIGLARKFGPRGREAMIRTVTINARPAILLFLDGELDQALSIDIAEGRISRIYSIRNPEKLTRMDINTAIAGSTPH